MRSFLVAAIAATALLSGCTPELNRQQDDGPVKRAQAQVSPADWVMSPDFFGPINMETTRSDALATGLYRAAPAPCSRQRVDSLGQQYEDVPGTDDRELAKPHLASITFDEDGVPQFIDPGKDTVTDRGIRKADSLSRLEISYGDDLIPGPDQSPRGGTFAVSGDRSHLVFVVMYGKVIGFFVAAGQVHEPADIMPVAGALTKPDSIRPGRAGVC